MIPQHQREIEELKRQIFELKKDESLYQNLSSQLDLIKQKYEILCREKQEEEIQ